MSGGLLWKLNRLRAMNIREVLHRVTTASSLRLEQTRVARGWAPLPAQAVKPRLSLFPLSDQGQDVGWAEPSEAQQTQTVGLHDIQPNLPFMTASQNWLGQWQANYQIEQAALDDLLQGKVGFFSHPPLDVGRPVNWHRDPLTGIEAPLSFGKRLNYRDDRIVGNVKILWELGRHQHLIPLATAYAVSGERRYRDAVAEQIEGWIDANPFGLGIHWCSALELALRLIAWATVHSLLALRDGDDGLFGAVADREKLGMAIYQQAWFVRYFLSRFSSANNHLIGELTGLWVACRVFDLGKNGEAWAALAQRELEREAVLQVFADGVDKEQACYYHLWVLEYFLFAWLVGKRAGCEFSEAFAKRIAAMAAFVKAITPPGGVAPQIGDADDGFVARFSVAWPEDAYREVLTAVEAVFGPVETSAEDDADSQDAQVAVAGVASESLPQKAFWYALMSGNTAAAIGQANATEQHYPRFFSQGGYAVLGNGRLHALFDAGSLGYPSIAAHGHADALNICLAVDGQWWLVDPGTYAYHSDHGWRDYFRGTAAHNTLQIDGANQSDIGGPFLWLRHARANLIDAGDDSDGLQWAVGEHDGYRKLGALHRRRIELDADAHRLKILDEIDGAGEHDLALHWHFAPDVRLAPGPELGAWLATKPGSGRQLLIETDTAWRWEVFSGSEQPILGWYSPALGLKVASPTLRGLRRGRLPMQISTIVRLA